MIFILRKFPLAARPCVERIEVQEAWALLELPGHLRSLYKHRLVVFAVIVIYLRLLAAARLSTLAHVADFFVCREDLIRQISRLVGHILRRTYIL
jgi:hypothetical protein